MLDAAEDVQSMMRFNLGNRVSFDAGRHGMKVGTIIKFNQKTVVVLDGGCQQNRPLEGPTAFTLTRD